MTTTTIPRGRHRQSRTQPAHRLCLHARGCGPRLTGHIHATTRAAGTYYARSRWFLATAATTAAVTYGSIGAALLIGVR
jgi:hypothetical protein